jgi:hypothetical protein
MPEGPESSILLLMLSIRLEYILSEFVPIKAAEMTLALSLNQMKITTAAAGQA